MKVAIINLIMKTVNFPEETEPTQKIESDKDNNIVELAIALSSYFDEVCVFASDSFKPIKTKKSKKVKIKYLKTRLKKVFAPAVLPFCPSIGKEINKGGFDAIIATEYHQISTIQAALAKQKEARLFVWQELDKQFLPVLPKILQKVFEKTGLKLIEKKIIYFIPRTSTAKKYLETIVPAKKILKPIPTPVNTGFFREIAKNNGFILDVTRLSQDRNLDFLIETAKLVTKKRPATKFVIAGNGPKKQWLEKEIIRQELTNNIKIVEKKKKEMPLLYSQSAMTIIHASGLFPFAALESMACSKPVISSYKGSLVDLIESGKTGFFVDSPAEMAEKILFLLKKRKKLSEIGKNARKKIVKDFSLNKVSKKFEKIIKGSL